MRVKERERYRAQGMTRQGLRTSVFIPLDLSSLLITLKHLLSVTVVSRDQRTSTELIDPFK